MTYDMLALRKQREKHNIHSSHAFFFLWGEICVKRVFFCFSYHHKKN